MESGTIVKWLKAEGEAVEKGEPLYELDTDKVTQEVEAEASGVLLKIAVPEGEVEVGHTIGFIGDQGEDVPEVADGGVRPQPVAPSEPVAETTGADPTLSAPQSSTSNGRVKASPPPRPRPPPRAPPPSPPPATPPASPLLPTD